jgi:purine catabolism regulator
MEVPDFNISSLDKNVLVLTTLFAHHESVERINAVVEKLCRQKVSAIVVKLGRYVNSIPESTLKIAERYDIPLLTIPGNILFREVIRDILFEIVQDQRSVINGVNELNEALIGAILRNERLDYILKTLSGSIECCCCCFSLDGTMLSEQHAGGRSKCGCKKEVVSFAEIAAGYEEQDNSSFYFQVGDFYAFPCSAQNQAMGFLLLRKNDDLTEKDLLFAKQAVSFLSIKFLEKQLHIETEQRMITSIMDDILFGQHTDETLIQEKLKPLGLTPQKQHFIMLFTRRNSMKNDSLVSQRNGYEYWRNRIFGLFKNSCTFLKGADYIVIASFSDKAKCDLTVSVRNILSKLIDVKHDDMDVGYSLFADSLCKLPDCYEQARKAVSYGRVADSAAHIYPYNDFLEVGLISHSIGSSDSKVVTEKIILPLLEYDTRCNTKLWDTLEKSLMARNLDSAAKELFVHISTLRYRLDKIKSLTGMDFFEPQGKFLLHLACVMAKANAR